MSKKRVIGVIVLLVLIALVSVVRLFHLHVWHRDFYQKQGDARVMRHVQTPGIRGNIYDRHGKVLAVSAPVYSVYINPQEFTFKNPKSDVIFLALGVNSAQLKSKIKQFPKRQFLYLKRHVSPNVVKKILNYDVPGVYSIKEYKRFYPGADSLGPVLGLTDVDGRGIAGLELAFNKALTGENGKKVYLKDIKGNIIKVLEEKAPVPGKHITLSLDRKMQDIVYRALLHGAIKNKAEAASAVLLDVKTGEVLAMANYPAFNPNHPGSVNAKNQRNRVVTDMFEPGSTFKPIAAASVMNTGEVTKDTTVNSNGGRVRIGRRVVEDSRDYGEMDVSFIIKKSSNVGISQLVLSVAPEVLPDTLQKLKFGQKTGVEFPGETSGVLPKKRVLKPFALSTLAFGYGAAANTLQLAQAYAVFARHGKHITPTLLKREADQIPEEPVLKADVADSILIMLEGVVEEGGTGVRAAIKGYRIAGKTGTSRKAGKGGYELDKYIALFAGIAPADNPKYVLVVMVDDPRGDKYYGGSVAAPIFKEAMGRILKLNA